MSLSTEMKKLDIEKDLKEKFEKVDALEAIIQDAKLNNKKIDKYDIVKQLFPDLEDHKFPKNPLALAIYLKNKKAFKYFVEKGANVNYESEGKAIVEYLLDEIKKNYNEKSELIGIFKFLVNRPDLNLNNLYGGKSILKIAVENQEFEIVKFLVENVRFAQNSETQNILDDALYVAIAKKDLKTIEFLLQNGAKVKQINGQNDIQVFISFLEANTTFTISGNQVEENTNSENLIKLINLIKLNYVYNPEIEARIPNPPLLLAKSHDMIKILLSNKPQDKFLDYEEIKALKTWLNSKHGEKIKILSEQKRLISDDYKKDIESEFQKLINDEINKFKSQKGAKNESMEFIRDLYVPLKCLGLKEELLQNEYKKISAAEYYPIEATGALLTALNNIETKIDTNDYYNITNDAWYQSLLKICADQKIFEQIKLSGIYDKAKQVISYNLTKLKNSINSEKNPQIVYRSDDVGGDYYPEVNERYVSRLESKMEMFSKINQILENAAEKIAPKSHVSTYLDSKEGKGLKIGF